MSALSTVNHNAVYTFTSKVTSVVAGGSDGIIVLEITDTKGVSRLMVFTPDSPGHSIDWTSGEWYRFESVVGCNPKRPLYDGPERRRERLKSSPDVPKGVVGINVDRCPNCAGELYLANALVLPEQTRQTIGTLPVEFMLVGTEESWFEHLGSSPDRNTAAESVEADQSPPRVKCSECSCLVREYYRKQCEKR